MLRKKTTILVSWILTLVMCYHIIGYAVLFRATDWMHRSVMEELLNKKELTILKVPNEFLKHHPKIFMRVNRREIVFNGNYYDVKEEVPGNSFTLFHSIKDTDEKTWNDRFCEVQTFSKGNHANGKPLKSFTKIFCPAGFSDFQFQFVQQNPMQCFLIFNSSNFYSPVEKLISPPPQA